MSRVVSALVKWWNYRALDEPNVRASTYYNYYDATGRLVNNGAATVNVRTVPIAANGLTYDTSRFDQSFAILPSAYCNLNSYSLSCRRPDGSRNIDDDILQARLDYGLLPAGGPH